MERFRKITSFMAVVLSVLLIIDGVYQGLGAGAVDWGNILVGALFLVALAPGAYENFRKK